MALNRAHLEIRNSIRNVTTKPIVPLWLCERSKKYIYWNTKIHLIKTIKICLGLLLLLPKNFILQVPKPLLTFQQMFAASTKLTAYGIVARNRQHCQTKEPATILRKHKLIGTSISEKNIILKCIKEKRRMFITISKGTHCQRL